MSALFHIIYNLQYTLNSMYYTKIASQCMYTCAIVQCTCAMKSDFTHAYNYVFFVYTVHVRMYVDIQISTVHIIFYTCTYVHFVQYTL